MDNFSARVAAVQFELKAPKGQMNKFGGYRYRSCEDILEAVKPVLQKYGMLLILSDEPVLIGDRFYIKATAKLMDTEKEACLISTAYAREAAEKKGMDESQITGAASSYARKYALNGLFCIDDTKDADTYAYTQTIQKAEANREIICERCGSFVYPVKKRNGEIWEPSDMEKYSKLRYNAVLCGDCMKKSEKEKKEGDQDARPD